MSSVVNLTTLLESVELARRDKKYEEMCDHAEKLTLELDDSILGRRLYSKLLYEIHMAAYQQAMAAEGKERTMFWEESLQLAEQSAKEAVAADDVLGKLLAEMNISGLLKKDAKMSARVCREAETIAIAASTTDEDRCRAWQVAMNTYFHRIRITMENKNLYMDPKENVAWLLYRVKDNPNFIAQKDEKWAREAVAEAEKFIQG